MWQGVREGGDKVRKGEGMHRQTAGGGSMSEEDGAVDGLGCGCCGFLHISFVALDILQLSAYESFETITRITAMKSNLYLSCLGSVSDLVTVRLLGAKCVSMLTR